MSKINAIRIVNLNYNNNAIRVSDEMFEMHGESTLLSLQNGGGKSVLVQMMLSPFVHKRYQNTKDRTFASYFTTNKPTFVMVEWKLDGAAGYALTGMMVRKNQEIEEESANELEMINFVAEYKKRCNQDIYHIPVVEKSKKEIVLKNFGACKQLFESYKRDREISFFYYDMNNSAQMKQYFQKLMEYQINYKEWESIVKKINIEESGLSNLFRDCRDEKGLVEKWFLEAVENKLNKEKNRMQEFQSIVEKYVAQYRDNKSKILRRDAIQSFQTEALQIQTEAENYRQLSEKKQMQEERIADFIARLNRYLSEENNKSETVQQEIQAMLKEIARLEYEKISGEIYAIQKKISFSASNWEILGMEKEDLEQKWMEITEKLQLLQCAKQQERVNEAAQEYEVEHQRLLLCKVKNENLEPERNALGGKLKGYYQSLIQSVDELIQECQQKIEALEEKYEQEKQERNHLIASEKELASEMGGLKAKIADYDDSERRFNRKYQTAFGRNILGEYEGGLLSVSRQEYEKDLKQSESLRLSLKRELEAEKENQRSLQRLLQDKDKQKALTESALSVEKEKRESFERELDERRIILRYFNVDEKKLFSAEEIFSAADRKIREAERAKNAWMIEENALQKEYGRLTGGKVLELPEDFEHTLEASGITYVYGMQWLQKNGKSVKENQKLVETHPFLPYSLIMTGKELERLKNLPEHIYTSFPIPILVREGLEQTDGSQGDAVQTFPKISFYLWFNENLLDEEKLSLMVREKERGIKKLQETIERKQQESDAYVEKRERIKNQKVTREDYEAVKETVAEIENQRKQLELEIAVAREQHEELGNAIEILKKRGEETEESIRGQRQRLTDFTELEEAYQTYEQKRSLLGQKQKEQERIENRKRLCEENIEKQNALIQSKKNERDSLGQELREYRAQLLHYEQYSVEAYGNSSSGAEKVLQREIISREDAEKMETRYRAITSELSGEQQELERRVEQAAHRKQECVEELQSLCEKYRLAEGQWRTVKYDRKEERHQEIEQEEKSRKIKEKETLMHEEHVRMEKQKTKEGLKREELKKQCGVEEVLPQGEIRTVDFDTEINERKYQKKEREEQAAVIQKRMQGYGELLAALAEYSDFVCGHQITWEQDLQSMTIKDLTRQKGILIRDYNQDLAEITGKRGDLDRLLGKISRMEQFQDDFYQKPIETLMNLTGHAAQILKQLDTILQSFQSLMEKLLVDISFVEKEKEKVVELVEDYLKEVHTELGKIDHNSTITVREKAIKMLKIGLPDWEENESLYRLRLQDYVDDVTEKGVAILEENQNITEFTGIRITTKALYDAVVGIANVQVRMYKIEAQREYPITWSDVAKNSGGEGFLSAFVILSSLLYYMRKDDSDIFADRNEGKVLIMDNPFAQTNAAHLLKPLMDMAKKTNTQLICLTGLGGESIYSRFDNIYVLTLIAANLRSGMQYLKADHMRGSEEETMIVSQIEVVQQELVF
ncbi:coiled-coil domain-containing protein [Hespellia stercorisuis]|uniref:Chromosome segregation ATPase n=1 Tax=Hespellia stercorisuis DSM 15480 TaxID=1121950 RepID=A0A1M6V4C1_9FIRM|nr:hypothetical protein [Hespellia stercorisuis]SHK76244.1 Chromosome segregation ATPase [Hespellia stercorisuis DSM 15480]